MKNSSKGVQSCAERKVITYLNGKIARAFFRESVAGGDSPLQSLKSSEEN